MTKEEFAERFQKACELAMNQGMQTPQPFLISYREYKEAQAEAKKRGVPLDENLVWKLRFERAKKTE